jgi:hypothetical protein
MNIRDEIRRFAIVVVDEFDHETDRFDIEYAETPKNLGFEMDYTTIETRLTTYFTSAREKKTPVTLNIVFLPPNAYMKINAFKLFVQKHMNDTVTLVYDDTVSVKQWEGKVQKFGQEELADWGGMVCPIAFLPGTPKYIRRDNTISIQGAIAGKSYPYSYPYAYGKAVLLNNIVKNDYFEEIPLRIYLNGEAQDPFITLSGSDGSIYSELRFKGLYLKEGEHLLIDSIRSKVLLYRDGVYLPAYDYVDKSVGKDTFLFVRKNDETTVGASIEATGKGSLLASYRQYVL